MTTTYQYKMYISKPKETKMTNKCDEIVEFIKSLDDKKAEKDIRIVILQRGWVMVGEYSRDGSNCYLKNCSTIRKWGTTKGLGELAENGKLSETVLDKQPDTEFHILTVIASIKCNVNKW